MSLSRPVRFPLLKLPFLCIECIVKNWNIFDILFFALFSKRTRQVVKHLKIPLKGIRIFVSYRNWMEFGRKSWLIRSTSSRTFFREHKNLRKDPLVLQYNAIPLYTSKTYRTLESYTDENEITALKIAMEFLNEVFKCSVGRVWINDENFPESGDIGVKLNLLLETLKTTDTCKFYVTKTKKDFYCDPKLFKCKKLEFWTGSAAWVTKEILLQFEIPQLKFNQCPFSAEDIVSFVTNWFHSDNKKLEYLYIYLQSTQISLKNFQTEGLNPVPFSERTRVPLSESFKKIDFSKGLEIVRHDGLEATIHVEGEDFMFYIWHNQ